MKSRLVIATLVLWGAVNAQAFAEGYLCVEEVATGFVYNGTKWTPSEMPGSKIVLRHPVNEKDKVPRWFKSNNGSNDLLVSMLGNKQLVGGCKLVNVDRKLLKSGTTHSFYDCSYMYGSFHFNSSTLRSIRFHNEEVYTSLGTTNAPDTNEYGVPFLALGTCSKI